MALSMLLSLLCFVPSTGSAQPGAALLPPSNDYGEDTDTDGFFEILVVEVTVEVYEAADYMVSVWLNDSEGVPIHSVGVGGFLSVGTHVVPVPLEGIKIWAHGIDGPYVVWAQLQSYPLTLIDEFLDLTDAYTYDQFEPLPAMFGAVTAEWAVDFDSNLRFEFLATDFTVDVSETNDYRVVCLLIKYVGSESVQLAEVEESAYLMTGTQSLSISVRGSIINAAELDGPYHVLLMLYDAPGGIPRFLDDIWHETGSYSYTEFEAGSLGSPLSAAAPVIDGVYDGGEWEDAVFSDLGRPDMENPFGAVILVKNSLTHLYVCIDALGDLTEDLGDYAAIAFDSGNDNNATDASEDQFIIGPAVGQTIHFVYSDAALDWVVHCAPFDGTIPDHEGVAAAAGFGTSDGLGAEHRIYELAIPLDLIGAVPGSVVGFATNGNQFYGIYDGSINNGTSWPYFMEKNASMVDYGDLTIGWPPISTSVSLLGTMGIGGWYVSEVNISLTASGGQLGTATIGYRLDAGLWNTYYSPFEFVLEGSHTLSYRSCDLGGNWEATKSLEFKLDLTAPATNASMSDRNLTLTATEGMSGVQSIWYRVDGGPWQNYTGPVELSGDTNHTVQYYSVDNAGNTEETKTLEVEKEEEGGTAGFFGLSFWLVLLIIALLILIGVPKLFGMRRKAKESDAKAANKDIGTAMAQFMDDSGAKKGPPPKEEPPPQKPGG
ncbi:MAG: hypothetical protein A3K76_01245 [Euryarchaeota archaeon RBG_13_57_23]|nr:MAG: hypothetical protein A3K76_01245 [Euryarchaeota archaeon RBG_13_57_23]